MTRRWGRAYDVWYKLLVAKNGEICYLCKKREDVRGRTELIIEHKDNIDTNYAEENLGLAHRSCNTTKNPPNVFPQITSQEGREREVQAHTQTISQRETLTQSEKHAKERGYWNEWVTDFFAGACPTANRKLGIQEGASIARISLDDLADLAVGEIGLRSNNPTGRYGNQQTYKKYIFEDRFINLFLETVNGTVYVSLRKPEQREKNVGTLVEAEEAQSRIPK